MWELSVGKIITHKECFVKFEGAGELPLELMDAVEPLQKHGAAFVEVIRVFAVAAAVCKLMAKVQPFHLHQHLETLRETSPSSFEPLEQVKLL